MDLIYADTTRKDIGVLQSYNLDMAYGSDENNFECSVDQRDHCCERGYFIYVENEEYGGVVDKIRVKTETAEIIYKGRTWHGILEKKIICPESGNDYLVLAGEANEVLQEIIDAVGLSSLFIASSEDSGIQIVSYQMDRYIDAYSGIKKMLKEFGAKLQIRWNNGMVAVSAEPRYDYSQDEEFDTSQVHFQLEKNYRPVNHMICLGQGDLKERAVIHIFTDEYGGVQQYLQNPANDPIQDSDYILDESMKVMFDEDEVVETFDEPNAEITTNYVLLSAKPSDWETNCDDYFQYEPKIEIINGEEVDTGGSYKEAAKVDVKYSLQKKQPYDWTENFANYFSYNATTDRYSNVSGTTTYQLLTSKPGGWAANYAEYYYKDGSTYKSVPGVTNTKYTKQTKQPSDWGKNYNKYYILYNDGTTSEYQTVNGVSYYTYDRQTSQPSDWPTNYGNYYRPATKKELAKSKNKKWYNVEAVKNKAPKWKAKAYYTRHSHQKAPKWGEQRRYTRTDTTVAPTWAANTYYLKKGDTAPTWAANTYYSQTDLKIAPPWVAGKYYKQYFDRYAVMVAGAIERLAELHASDELDIDLEETEQVYDVGDIVGTIENTTGMSAIQEVVKKIIKIDNDDIVISYEVG